MEMIRTGSKIVLDLDKEEAATGLFAVLSGKPEWVTPEVFAYGQEVYNWFFGSVHKLAKNYNMEKSLKTMSAETLTRLPVLAKKLRKR